MRAKRSNLRSNLAVSDREKYRGAEGRVKNIRFLKGHPPYIYEIYKNVICEAQKYIPPEGRVNLEAQKYIPPRVG